MMLISLMLSTNLIAISSKNMISTWYYMEIASFIFLYFLMKMNNPIKSSVIYFIMSFLTTLFLLLSIVMMNKNLIELNCFMKFNNMNSILISMAFLMKMGMIPMHSWVYKMSENMEWTSLMILFSIQKITPIWAIMYLFNKKMFIVIMIMSILILPWLPMKTKNSFFLLSTSSIINNTWIIMSSMISSISSLMYTITYFIMNSNFIYMLKMNNSKTINFNNSINMVISMMSLMGFPPTPNFFIKLMILKNMFTNNLSMMFMSISIIFLNMMSSIMYMKFITMSIMNFKNSINWTNFKKNKNMINTLMNLSPLLFIFNMSNM